MKYFVYFDAYGHARQIISEYELAEKYGNAADTFSAAMCRKPAGAPHGHTTGHVRALCFDSPKQLSDCREGLGDEMAGFYGCRSESRPYNF